MATNDFEALAMEFKAEGVGLSRSLRFAPDEPIVVLLAKLGLLVVGPTAMPENPNDTPAGALVQGVLRYTFRDYNHFITRTQGYWFDPYACGDRPARLHRTTAMPSRFRARHYFMLRARSESRLCPKCIEEVAVEVTPDCWTCPRCGVVQPP